MQTDILESLLVSTHRLTRLAAQSTGSTTPAAQWRTLSILETDGPMRIGELASDRTPRQPRHERPRRPEHPEATAHRLGGGVRLRDRLHGHRARRPDPARD